MTEQPDTGMSDDDLLAALARGHGPAARVLAERHLPQVHGLAFRLLGSREEAEDLTQDVFVKAWRQAPKWQAGRAKFSTWLYRVTYNACLDRLRKRREFATDKIPDRPDDAPDPEEHLAAAHESERVRRAMRTLPERQQAALALVYDQEMSGPEAADLMGISVEALDSLLARARRGVRARLTRETGHRPAKERAR